LKGFHHKNIGEALLKTGSVIIVLLFILMSIVECHSQKKELFIRFSLFNFTFGTSFVGFLYFDGKSSENKGKLLSSFFVIISVGTRFTNFQFL
jgi:hypothetical protein